jgi:phenylalanyl-tRNA synthetase beta chain
VKVLVSWLRELVDVPVTPAVLANDLHMAGFEVASVGSDPLADRGGQTPDAVIDFEITANRPDCLSMIGLAREVATKYGTTIHAPRGADLGPADAGTLGPLTVTIENPTGCPRYCAAIADVTVGPSPAWLAARLSAAGIRPISNIVDITNYVLLELGHPLHAFDLGALAGPALHIRDARPAEALTTLDGQKRTLTPEMLVIADRDRAQALAGIMGGRDSEVSPSTTTIAIESAWFEPTSIRKTSKRLGLSTEASYRFERGADFAAAAEALARTCRLIEEIGAGTVRRGWIDACAVVPEPRVVCLAYARVGAVLGADVHVADIRRILSGLGFMLAGQAPDHALVSVPSWRVDVSRDVDLIEEVARHYGYDRLPATFPALAQVPPPPDEHLEQDRALRRLATAAGFSECVTFSFISEKAAREFAAADQLVAITNPLSELFAVLRPSLLPGLVDAVAHNRRHGQRDVRLFELGTRFRRGTGESRTLSLAWSGAAAPEHWSGRPRPADLFDLIGVVEVFGRAMGLSVEMRAAERAWLTPGRTAEVHAVDAGGDTRLFGVVGHVQTSLTAARDIPTHDDVLVAELDLDAVVTLVTMLGVARTHPLPRFPSIVRDLSILVDESLLAAQVRGTIQAVAPPTLVRVAEFDRYHGKGIADGKVSLSYRLTFQAPDRTLTDAEADAAMTTIIDALVKAHGAVRR